MFLLLTLILARCTTVSGVFAAVKLAEHQKGDNVNRQNKAKGRISKRVLQEKKVLQIFRETNIIYPLIAHARIRALWRSGVIIIRG